MSDPITAIDLPGGAINQSEETINEQNIDHYGADQAFLTANNLIHDDRPSHRTVHIYEKTVAGKEIQDRYGHLNDLCSNLDGLVKKMMDDQESSFFLAYKEHMKKVLKEFDALKHKADEEEARARYDVRIRSLEDELEWFTKEALRLDELAKLYKKEWDKWRTKAEALDEDRKFMEDQLKASKREIHTLRAAVERAQLSLANNLVQQQNNGLNGGASSLSNGGNSQSQIVPVGALDTAGSQRKGSARSGQRSTTLPPINGSKSQQMSISQHHNNINDSSVMMLTDSESQIGGGNSGNLKPEQEQRYLDIIASMKAQLEREQKANRQLRTSRTTAYAEKSELEEFFLKCVDEVRRDISRRRVTAKSSVPHSNPGNNNGIKSSPNARNRQIEEVAYDSFTQGDRKKVLELLLTSDDVLVFLYEKLFPHRSSGVGGGNGAFNHTGGGNAASGGYGAAVQNYLTPATQPQQPQVKAGKTATPQEDHFNNHNNTNRQHYGEDNSMLYEGYSGEVDEVAAGGPSLEEQSTSI